MDLLWSAGAPRTVRHVYEDLREQRQVAYTTVMTVMDNLHRKGWLHRQLAGRAYLYEPVRSREVYSAELMGEALAASADRTATLMHFVERMAPEEARLLRDALVQTMSEREPAGPPAPACGTDDTPRP